MKMRKPNCVLINDQLLLLLLMIMMNDPIIDYYWRLLCIVNYYYYCVDSINEDRPVWIIEGDDPVLIEIEW